MKTVYFLLLLVFCNFSYSESEVVDAEDFNPEQIRELKESRLNRARINLNELSKQIRETKRKIRKEKSSRLRVKLEEQLISLEEEFAQQQLSLVNIVSDVNIDEVVKKVEEKKLSLAEEIQEILKPLFESIKRISSKPREVERLKSNIEDLNAKLLVAKQAKKSLKEFAKTKSAKKFSKILPNTRKKIDNIVNELEAKAENSQAKLYKIISDEKSMFEQLQELITRFFITEGKNILIAMIIFLLTIIPLRYWRTRILNFCRRALMKYTNTTIDGVHSEWLMRPISISYNFLTFILATSFMIFGLYVMNDWVLVTIILLIIFATGWSLKNQIPSIMDLFRLLLNFGPVREKERLIWKGIPWKVKKLGFYSILENPELDGATIRLHYKELIECNSRPVNRDEPWFPTHKSDWVELSDDTYGQVMLQTPEVVIVRLIGGAFKHVPTADFMLLNPINLSQDFLVTAEFGVDYSHQELVTSEIPAIFRQHLESSFEEELNPQNKKFRSLLVEFDNAGASSLNIRVNINVNGHYASEKLNLQRRLQKELVYICNLNKYVIPFNQMTVHLNQSLTS